jgi:TRAP-type C4-dicarboxylate transport system substrate-binding protein
MQTGVIEATDTSSGSFVSFRLYEQIKCLTAPGGNALWFMYEPVVMAKKKYDSLDKKQQDALMAASKMSEAYFDKETRGLDAKMVDAFKKNGVEVTELSQAQFAAWREVAKKTSYKVFAEKVKGGEALIEKALSVK